MTTLKRLLPAKDGLSVGGHRIALPNPALLQPPYDVILVLAISLLGFAFAGWATVRLAPRSRHCDGGAPSRDHDVGGANPLAIVLTDDAPGARAMTISAIIWTFGPLFLSAPGSFGGGRRTAR